MCGHVRGCAELAYEEADREKFPLRQSGDSYINAPAEFRIKFEFEITKLRKRFELGSNVPSKAFVPGVLGVVAVPCPDEENLIS
jgi:hypothetical protein